MAGSTDPSGTTTEDYSRRLRELELELCAMSEQLRMHYLESFVARGRDLGLPGSIVGSLRTTGQLLGHLGSLVRVAAGGSGDTTPEAPAPASSSRRGRSKENPNDD